MMNSELVKFFDLEDVGSRLDLLETPVPIVDIDIAARNLRRWQMKCDERVIANRPHIKTHKLAGFAKLQLALGARGITVQKLGEAEVMADAGINDILLTFNVVGENKIARLGSLRKRVDISVVADSEMVVSNLQDAAGLAGKSISVFVECDTGAARNGVQTPMEAAHLATLINQSAGLRFAGLMTYPRPGTRLVAERFFHEASTLISAIGFAVPIVTSGGTPDMWSDEGLDGVTEYRAGTYIYGDRSMVERQVCGFEDCAVSVLSTVVSTPTSRRAILDAGSKALTSDLLGMQGYGVVRETGFSRIYDISEEHGFLDVEHASAPLRVGSLVRIVPNHVCPVSNLFDRVVLVSGERVLGAVRVDARGAVQ